MDSTLPQGEFVEQRLGYATMNGTTLPPQPQPLLQQSLHPSPRFGHEPYAAAAPANPATHHDYAYQPIATPVRQPESDRKGEPTLIPPQEVTLYSVGNGPPAPQPPLPPPGIGYATPTTMHPAANGYGRQPYPPNGMPLHPAAIDHSHATNPAPMMGVPAMPPPPPLPRVDYHQLFSTLEHVYNGIPNSHVPPTNPEERDQLPPDVLKTLIESALGSLKMFDPVVADRYQRDHAAFVSGEEASAQKELEDKVKEARMKLESDQQVSLPVIEEESDAGDDLNGVRKKRQRREEKGGSEPQQCQTCGVRSSPEWRRGPLGPRTLCNACGLVWIKIMKRRANGLPDEEEDEENNEEAQSNVSD